MKIRTTRAAVLAAALLCVLGGLSAVALPSASATPDVTVTWPEITSFESDSTAYVVDLAGATDKTLFMVFKQPGEGGARLSLEELAGTGRHELHFPTTPGTVQGVFVLQECAAGGWGDGCTVIAASPVLTVTRVGDPPAYGEVPTVTWPDTKALNPELTTYSPDVTWDGKGSLFLFATTSGSDQKSLPEQISSPGSFDVPFPSTGSGATWSYKLFQCPGKTLEYGLSCRFVGWAEHVDAWRALDVNVGYAFRRPLGPSQPISLEMSPAVLPVVDVQWEVLDGDTVVAQGSADDVVTDGGLPPLGPQPTLLDGHDYEYRATVSSESESFGHLEDTASYPFRWDNQVVADLRVSRRVFYPVRDKYRDSVSIQIDQPAGVEQLASASLEISDLDGQVVKRMTFDSYNLPYRGDAVYWDGELRKGELAPEGRYDIAVTVTDAVGNTRVLHSHVTLDHASLKREVWRHSFTPAESVLERQVGACGAVHQPARAGWKRSVGYRVRSCSQSGEGYAATVNGIYLPDPGANPTGHKGYTSVRLRAQGGHARGAGHPGLQYFYLDNAGNWHGGKSFGPTIGWHEGWRADHKYVVTRDDEPSPIFYWSVGLGTPGGYDVKRFEVVATYWVFE